jgi:hypothetical protein
MLDVCPDVGRWRAAGKNGGAAEAINCPENTSIIMIFGRDGLQKMQRQ